MQITRQQFKDAIEAGIARCPNITAYQAAALRSVGSEATAFGNNFDTDPGCPMTLAGLWDGEVVVDERVLPFYGAFDDAMSALLNTPDDPHAYSDVKKIEVL